MNAHLLGLLLALSSQLADDRYPAAADAAVAPAVDRATDAAADDASAGQPSQIIIAPDTPTPTLDETPAAAAGATTPDLADPTPANPFTPAPPAGQGAPPAAATAAAPAEASVLAGGPKPADLMRTLLSPPASGMLSGVPTSLGDAVRGAVARHEQTERAQAYWALSAAVTNHYLALQEVDELAALRTAVAAPNAAWDAAREQLERRVQLTGQAATAAQLRLHRLMGASAGGSLPLPADAPHCGRYNTRYDEIFAIRTDPTARQLNELLPLIHAELVAKAQQVADAHQWLTYVSDARDPATDGTGLLRAYELWSLRRREFVDAARGYNEQIAVYAELAAPDDVAPERLVAMLIRTSAATAPGAAASGVQPAGAFEESPADPPAGAGAAETRGYGDPPRTFAERQRTEAWRPFARFRNRERSIVVGRQLLRRPGRK